MSALSHRVGREAARFTGEERRQHPRPQGGVWRPSSHHKGTLTSWQAFHLGTRARTGTRPGAPATPVAASAPPPVAAAPPLLQPAGEPGFEAEALGLGPGQPRLRREEVEERQQRPQHPSPPTPHSAAGSAPSCSFSKTAGVGPGRETPSARRPRGTARRHQQRRHQQRWWRPPRRRLHHPLVPHQGPHLLP